MEADSALAELASRLQPYQCQPAVGEPLLHMDVTNAPVVEIDGERILNGDYPTFLFSSGRGVGKTFGGSSDAVLMAMYYSQPHITSPEKKVNVFAVGPTWSHTMDVMMFEEDSSILGVLAAVNAEDLVARKGRKQDISRNTATSVPHIRLDTPWRKGETRIVGLSAQKPNSWRGKEGQGAWWDEPSVAIYAEDCWKQLRQLLRKSEQPRLMMTCTPDHQAPSRHLIWTLAKAADGDPDALASLAQLAGFQGSIVRRSVPSWENEHMPQEWRDSQREAAETGSAWARQEVLGELVEAVLDALLSPGDILWVPHPSDRDIVHVDIGVDPAVADGRGDEWGIVATAEVRTPEGMKHKHVTIDDMSMRGHTDIAMKTAAECAAKHRARAVYVESNQGSDVLMNQMKAAMQRAGLNPAIIKPKHASERKDVRADPIAAAVRRKTLAFSEELRGSRLVSQATTWQPSIDKRKSPDRVDGWVWSCEGYKLGGGRMSRLRSAASVFAN